MRIASARNPSVRYLRSLARAPVRRSEGAYLTEGVRLVTEALESGQPCLLALYDPDSLERTDSGSSLLQRLPEWAGRAYEATPTVIAAASQTETPAGVIAALRIPSPEPLSSHRQDRLGLILDGLADPGNAGTILRSAAAFGARYVVTVPGSADLYSPKVVRAGMGAHFRLSIYPHIAWTGILDALAGTELVAADARGSQDSRTFIWPERAALVIGREALGLTSEAEAAVSRRVRIPMSERVESLNAATAASILLYSALGQQLPGERSRYI